MSPSHLQGQASEAKWLRRGSRLHSGREPLRAPCPAEEPDVVSSSERYARRFAGPVGAWFLQTQTRATLELLADLGGPLRILDVGGGHAQLAPALIEAGHEVTVLGSTAECGERLRPWTDDGRCRFDVGSLRALPYADAAFDVVISFRILSHMADPEAFVAELCRVSSGTVLLDFPSRRSVNILADTLFALKLRIEGNTRSFGIFAPERIRAMFARNTFAFGPCRPQFLFPMALHRLLGSAAAARVLESPWQRLRVTQAFGSPVIVRADRVRAD